MPASPSQPDHQSVAVSLRALAEHFEGLSQRIPDHYRRMRVWYRKWAYENGMYLAVPYEPETELLEALAVEREASSPVAEAEEAYCRGRLPQLLASISQAN